MGKMCVYLPLNLAAEVMITSTNQTPASVADVETSQSDDRLCGQMLINLFARAANSNIGDHP
jgi:hypothetical protein